jgi:crotonobetainyl-CoA:carnitine CoA-transferase CaiB-like acyl-CoA transferase
MFAMPDQLDAAPLDVRAAAPLAGVRVLDLTTFLSGPFCAQILADLGAEIIKIESFEGDPSRAIPPYFVGDDSAYYLSTNRSKRSVSLNLKTPDGLRLLEQLIARADVVVENFRPDVCVRLGLDIEKSRRLHPGLIWASISGFGQSGPRHLMPAYDMIVQALSGVMSLTGETGGGSVRLGIPAGDLVAGLYAAIAINAALADRMRTGQGRVIDVAMLDCQLAMLSYQAQYALVSGMTPGRQGARHDSIPTYRSFVAGDGGELVVTANTERMWRDLCAVLGLQALVEDPRFANGAARLENRAALWSILEDAFTQRSAHEWVDDLLARNVPAALIKTVTEALADARNGSRDMVIEVAAKDGRHIAMVGNPIKFVGETQLEPGFPPKLGEDTAHVLTELLSLPKEEVASLQARGVIRVADCPPLVNRAAETGATTPSS